MTCDEIAEREALAIARLSSFLGQRPPEPPYIARLRKACRRWRYGWIASVKAHARIQAGLPVTNYNPVTAEDRKRMAEKRLERIKRMLLLRYEPRRYISIKDASEMIGYRERTLYDWTGAGHVRASNGMVYVPDLRKHLAIKLAV